MPLHLLESYTGFPQPPHPITPSPPLSRRGRLLRMGITQFSDAQEDLLLFKLCEDRYGVSGGDRNGGHSDEALGSGEVDEVGRYSWGIACSFDVR